MKKFIVMFFLLFSNLLVIIPDFITPTYAATTEESTDEITLSLNENGFVTINGDKSQKRRKMVNSLLKKMLIFFRGMMGIVDIILAIILVKNITIFASSGGNPQKRSASISKLIYNVVGIVLCGGAFIITALLYNSFK